MEAVTLPARRYRTVGLLFFEREVDVMVLAFASHTQSPCLDAWKDDSDEFAKGRRVERYHSFGTAATRILRVNSIARH